MKHYLGQRGQGLEEGAGAALGLLRHPGHEAPHAAGEDGLLGGAEQRRVVRVGGGLQRAAAGRNLLLPRPAPRLLEKFKYIRSRQYKWKKKCDVSYY